MASEDQFENEVRFVRDPVGDPIGDPVGHLSVAGDSGRGPRAPKSTPKRDPRGSGRALDTSGS